MVVNDLVSPAPRTVASALDGHVQGNAGLCFERYLRIWQEGTVDGVARQHELRPVLKAFVREYNELGANKKPKAGGPAQALAAYNRRLERLDELLDRRPVTLKSAWRLTAGLGNAHPIENGFMFDTLLGVPVLPGSSVKGLCRAAGQLLGKDDIEMHRLFGPERIEREGDAATGELVFYDAYPKHWPQLCVDIINCHHPNYYADPKTNQPVETESPQPVFFLALEAGIELVFRIGRRGNASDSDLKTAEELLRRGLDYLGIGAKTAVGYGFMA